MPGLSFSDLMARVTLDTWKKVILTVSDAVGLATENWQEGGISRSLVAMFAQMYTTSGDAVRNIAASAFLDTAEGAWLRFLAKQVFGVDAIEASFASAPQSLTLTNHGGGLYPYKARELVVAHQDTHKTYRNTSAGTLNPGVGQTLMLDLEADEAGSDSNAGVGTITVMVTTALGVTCTNTVALLGLDEEKAPALRQRCRDARAALSIGGPKGAYEYFARSAKRANGTSVGVTRVRVPTAPGDGTLTVYVAGASGTISDDDVAVVQLAFDTKVTPYGFNVTAVSASNLSISAPSTIWIPSSLGMSEADARQIVFDSLQAFVEEQPIGGVVISPATGKIYWRQLSAVIGSAIPGTLKVQLTTEADIDVSVGEVPVWGGILSQTAVVQVTT